jgi:hypothetical protein
MSFVFNQKFELEGFKSFDLYSNLLNQFLYLLLQPISSFFVFVLMSLCQPNSLSAQWHQSAQPNPVSSNLQPSPRHRHAPYRHRALCPSGA